MNDDQELEQVGWWSEQEQRFNRVWELDPSAPQYRGDAVPVYRIQDKP